MDEKVKAIARPAASRSLRQAIGQARVEEAERISESADWRDSEIARLEILKVELEDVFAQVPQTDDRFSLVLVPSKPARLWIDLFTYAVVAEGEGDYLLVRSSDAGRRTLFSSPSASAMADRITRYIAHEIVRRERQEAALLEPIVRPEYSEEPEEPRSRAGLVIAAFVIGILAGAGGLLAAVWLSIP
ncbi:hypothetical protein A7A08_02289 [Methyloligella halotolerans]|uniref:Uncharacterized protein n=1 Tax=Methyloligella halotolerans TaxID=1177755 RepID=A0A1E2RXW7_9HYPH|nr:hypothetical protein [Methyloligella halotolerans]ODA66992.1 hypothetical protein A7A08_02289 [Methyloligella halotolerans]